MIQNRGSSSDCFLLRQHLWSMAIFSGHLLLPPLLKRLRCGPEEKKQEKKHHGSVGQRWKELRVVSEQKEILLLCPLREWWPNQRLSAWIRRGILLSLTRLSLLIEKFRCDAVEN